MTSMSIEVEPETAFSAEPVSQVPPNMTFSEYLFTLPPSSSSGDFCHQGNASGAENSDEYLSELL